MGGGEGFQCIPGPVSYRCPPRPPSHTATAPSDAALRIVGPLVLAYVPFRRVQTRALCPAEARHGAGAPPVRPVGRGTGKAGVLAAELDQFPVREHKQHHRDVAMNARQSGG